MNASYAKYRDKASKKWIVTWRGRKLGEARSSASAEAIICDWIRFQLSYPERAIELLLAL